MKTMLTRHLSSKWEVIKSENTPKTQIISLLKNINRTSTLQSPYLSLCLQQTVSSLPTQQWPLI